MSTYQDLQTAYSQHVRSERSYWLDLLKTLEEFGADFVKHLELPTQKFVYKAEEHPYVRIGQIDEASKFRLITASDYPKKERSIPFTIIVSVLCPGVEGFQDFSIDMTLSAIKGGPSFYSRAFPSDKQSFPFIKSNSGPLMDEILSVLKGQTAGVKV